MNDTTNQEIRQFLLDSLTEMNYSVEDVDDDTALGPAGADLESLSLAELAVRVEDRFGVRFDCFVSEKTLHAEGAFTPDELADADGLGPNGSTTGSLPSWNSAHANESCANTAPRGGSGRIYCFAVN